LISEALPGLGLAAYWADDAASKLASALNTGLVHGTQGGMMA